MLEMKVQVHHWELNNIIQTFINTLQMAVPNFLHIFRKYMFSQLALFQQPVPTELCHCKCEI